MKNNTWILTVCIVGSVFLIGSFLAYKIISDNEDKKDEISKAPKEIAASNIIDKSLVAPDLINSTKSKPIGDFTFIDQLGDTVTQEIVKGKVYVAEYFFTTCKGICPAMNRQMTRVHNKFKENDNFAILSHTVLPHVDSVEAMKAYSELYDATPKKWYFLTGEKEELYRIARNSYFVLKPAEVKGGGEVEAILSTQINSC